MAPGLAGIKCKSITFFYLIYFLAQALRGNSVLSELSLRGCNIDVKGTTQIAMELRRVTTLTVIDLSFNAFDSAGMGMLGKLMAVSLCGVPCRFPSPFRGDSVYSLQLYKSSWSYIYTQLNS